MIDRGIAFAATVALYMVTPPIEKLKTLCMLGVCYYGTLYLLWSGRQALQQLRRKVQRIGQPRRASFYRVGADLPLLDYIDVDK